MALVAALLLVLQTAAGAFAVGAGATPVARDVYGNPLCLTSGSHAAAQDPAAPAHDSLPGCCTLACGLAAPCIGAAPDPLVLAAPLAMVAPAATKPGRALPRARPLERSPANPRAPPPG